MNVHENNVDSDAAQAGEAGGLVTEEVVLAGVEAAGETAVEAGGLGGSGMIAEWAALPSAGWRCKAPCKNRRAPNCAIERTASGLFFF